MERMIDADALVKRIENAYCKGCDNYNYIRCRACGTNDAINMIDESPTIDAIPVEWLEHMMKATTLARTSNAIKDVLALWKRMGQKEQEART